jgi:zinc/manganese transport system substrate-binding protein
MRRLITGLIAAAIALGLPVGGAEAAEKLRVVASLPDLRALTEAVGGDLVEVETLARGDQNPHDLEVRPSLMVKLRRADLLVRNGVDGDPWVEPLVRGAGNSRLAPGGPGVVDVSRGIQVLGVPQGPVDRSRGDVHPEGNPHFTLDPANAAIVTANILEGLARLAPEHRATFEARRREWLGRLDVALRRWQESLAPYRGARVITNHDLWIYFLDRFGLVSAGTVEDRPGIPPSPGHVADLIRRMKNDQVRVVIYEPWADRKLIDRIARETGAQALGLATAVGATKEATSYLDLFEFNVRVLAQALR